MHPRSTPTRLPRWGPRAGCVAPRSNTPGIATPPRKTRAAGAPVLGRRALPPGRLAGLGATPDFRHGLLAIIERLFRRLARRNPDSAGALLLVARDQRCSVPAGHCPAY